MKIVVGLSGGVDSSVALLLLKNDGYDVSAITMKIWDKNYKFEITKGKHACLCPDEDEEITIAKKVCDILDVKHEVIDLSKEYREKVLSYFSSEYIAGRTPNPCVVCNREIKFGSLFDYATKNSAKFATGHYAINRFDEHFNRFSIIRNNSNKDQSYFLCRLSQGQLSKCIFRLGYLTKEQVRDIARKNCLPTSEIKDSQNFFSGDHCQLIEKQNETGSFLSEEGLKVGTHSGYWHFTIGQKHDGKYVKEIRKDTNEVILTDRVYSVAKNTFEISDINFVSDDKVSSNNIFVKVRSSGALHRCVIKDNVVSIESQTIISPGQFAVFYDEIGYLLFSGVIK